MTTIILNCILLEYENNYNQLQIVYNAMKEKEAERQKEDKQEVEEMDTEIVSVMEISVTLPRVDLLGGLERS